MEVGEVESIAWRACYILYLVLSMAKGNNLTFFIGIVALFLVMMLCYCYLEV